MTKNRYEVTGVDSKGEQFYGTCVAYDIISAIQLFRDNGYSAYTVQSRIQVCKDEKIRIENVQYYKYDRYATYKAIMKHHQNAMDEIHTLEEAKDIISMITGNIYLNGEIYQMEQELKTEFLSGDKKTIDKMIEKLTANRETNIEPDEDIIEYRCKLCGANIAEDNRSVCDKCASEYKF